MSFTTTNMALRAWDQGDDPYAHSELASNFVAIDAHDHTPGKGARIPTAGLADNSVTNAKIADAAVGTSEIIDASVTGHKLALDVLPLGIVQFWYRQTLGEAVPVGFEVCDGRAWNTIPNDLGYTTGNIPDLINKFAMGSTTPGAATGGTNTLDLSHTHTVAGHSHTIPLHSHTIAPHAHGIGAHVHSIPTEAGLKFLDDGGNPQTLLQRGTPVGGGADRQFAYVPNLNSGDAPSAAATMTSHNHGGSTGATSGGTDSQGLTTDPSTSGSTDVASASTGNPNTPLNTTENRPAYVGLLPIMRVRR